MNNKKGRMGKKRNSISSEHVLNSGTDDELQLKIGRLLYIAIYGGGDSKVTAVEGIRKLEAAEEYPLHLAEFILNPKLQTSVRIFASTKLKKFVEAHWCVTIESDLIPKITVENKTKLKVLLLNGLSEPTTQVREAVASIITTILPWEWPHDWPVLIETLVACLNGDSENGVHGALLVLDNFDLSRGGAHYMQDVLTILRVVNRVFASEKYSEEVRCLPCKIFSRVVPNAAQKEDPHTIQRYLQPAVSSFCAALVPSWTSGVGGSRLKIEILDTVGMLMDCIPKYLSDFLPDIIHLIWGTLIDCAKDYRVNVVNRAVRNGNGNESVCNEEQRCSTDLVTATVKFIKQLMSDHNRAFAHHLLDEHEWISLQDSYVPPHALCHLIMLMEVPDEQIEQWNTDVDDFVEKEETQKRENDGIRRTVQEIIVIIGGQNRLVANNLIAEIMKYLEIEKTMRLHGQSVICQKSWKSLEAFLLAFSIMKNNIIPHKDGKCQQYNVQSILRTVVFAELHNPASPPLLVGRCLIVGGIYADQMYQPMAAAFLEATAAGLGKNQAVCVKIHAAKAVHLWCCQNISGKNYGKILPSYFSNFFKGLLNLAEQFESTGVHMLVVKSIASLMSITRAYTASVASCIYSLTETALDQYHHHLTNSSHSVLTVFKELVLNPGCTQLLQEKLAPTLLGMMTNPPSDKYNVAIDIVTVLAEHSTLPLRDLLNSTLFPAACKCIIKTDESGLQYRGINMIHKFLFAASEEGITCEAKYGENRAQCIIQVIVHALNRNPATSMIEEICDVLIRLIREAHDKMGENIDDLLRTLLNHMRNEKSTHYRRRILMVFAYLICAHSTVVVNYLANTEVSLEPKTSLETIISEGFCREYNVLSGDQRQIVKCTLGKILEHGVTDLSSPLHHITFRDGSGPVIPLLARICQMTTASNKRKAAKRRDSLQLEAKP